MQSNDNSLNQGRTNYKLSIGNIEATPNGRFTLAMFNVQLQKVSDEQLQSAYRKFQEDSAGWTLTEKEAQLKGALENAIAARLIQAEKQDTRPPDIGNEALKLVQYLEKSESSITAADVTVIREIALDLTSMHSPQESCYISLGSSPLPIAVCMQLTVPNLQLINLPLSNVVADLKSEFGPRQESVKVPITQEQTQSETEKKQRRQRIYTYLDRFLSQADVSQRKIVLIDFTSGLLRSLTIVRDVIVAYYAQKGLDLQSRTFIYYLAEGGEQRAEADKAASQLPNVNGSSIRGLETGLGTKDKFMHKLRREIYKNAGLKLGGKTSFLDILNGVQALPNLSLPGIIATRVIIRIRLGNNDSLETIVAQETAIVEKEFSAVIDKRD